MLAPLLGALLALAPAPTPRVRVAINTPDKPPATGAPASSGTPQASDSRTPSGTPGSTDVREAPADPSRVRANKELLHRYHQEVWEQGRLQEAGKYLGPGFKSHASPLHDPAGQKTGADLLRVLRTAFPDLTSTEEALLGDGDLVTIRWTIRGTHTGAFLGVPPTGRRIEVTGMDMLRMENGKFVEHWGGLRDQLEVILGQLKGP